MMSENTELDWKQKYEELLFLTGIMGSWGQAAKDHISTISSISILFSTLARRAFTPGDKQYGVLQHSAYHNLLKSGPEPIGYQKACEILKRTLREGDKNTSAALMGMRLKKAQTYLPEIPTEPGTYALAAKYKAGSLKKLLKP